MGKVKNEFSNTKRPKSDTTIEKPVDPLQKHATAIKDILEQWRRSFKVLDSYWFFEPTLVDTKSTGGKLCPYLGPSFEYEEVWTILQLREMQELFYKAVQRYMITNNLHEYEVKIHSVSYAQFAHEHCISFIKTFK